jgi:two-component system CitB family sensor kinase
VAEVSVRLAQGVREVKIEVADSGPGIAASVRSSIFEGGWSTKPDTAGRVRGLGLALVRQLVDQMGGSVEVAEGPGARFRVAIPSARTGARP